MEEAIRQAAGTTPAAAAATKVLPHKPPATSPRGKQTKQVTTAQVWHLLRRLLVLAAAGLYVFTTLDGGVKAMRVLYGVADDSLKYPSLSSNLIVPYAGASTIQKSRLVTSAGGAAKRNDTMYLVSATTVSFTSCPKLPTYNAWMYGNDFLREQYADLVRDTSYNITLFKTSDLIAPVVDCTTFMLRSGTTMYMRVFYLLVDKTDPELVSLVTHSFSMQDYRFPDQYQTGVAGVLVLSVVTDMRFLVVDNYYYALALGYPFRKPSYSVFELRGDTEDGYRIFESVPVNPATDVTRVIYSSWRTGLHNTASETEQCNIKNINWEYRQDPMGAMKDWVWVGWSILHDAWGWVHVMHFLFAADMIFNLAVLLLVIYRNMKNGKFWIGDAFVSVSRSVVFRGAIVLLAWILNGFWSLMEFCIQDSKVLSATPVMFIYEEILHADLLVLYLSIAGLIGFVLRERIDPALAVFLFEISFVNRDTIAKWFPDAVDTVVKFSLEDSAKGMMPVPPKLAGITPMRFRTTHELHARPIAFILATLLPIIVSFAVILAYVPLRKIHRKFFPDRMVQLSRGTNLSTESESILAWKSSLTMFEVATGAALQNRVGLVSDYDNCVYIKGMKFASADGIFCNGFVVANGKWLMRTGDLMLILGMLITRVRFADVYVYEVEAYTVQKNARLFYPEMMTIWEVFQLNTMILA